MDGRGKEIEEAIALLCKSLREMMGEMESGAYTPRPLPLTMLKNMTRETYQDLYRRQALEVIRKLKLNEPIDQEEARLVEEWMVGDLEIYQVMEGHYREWREEVLQHCDGLASIGRAGLQGDAQGLLMIRASLMELEHILGDIDHYRYALDRLERFRSYVGQDLNALDRQDKAKLADHMASMVYSDLY